MLNLLNNAIKYTDDGSVTFRISGEMADKVENGFRLHIEVEDTGRGIKEEDMLRIFDSFERIDVAKNKMKPPINAPTQAGTAIKVGALPFAVEAVIGLNTFSSATIGCTSTDA